MYSVASPVFQSPFVHCARPKMRKKMLNREGYATQKKLEKKMMNRVGLEPTQLSLPADFTILKLAP